MHVVVESGRNLLGMRRDVKVIVSGVCCDKKSREGVKGLEC